MLEIYLNIMKMENGKMIERFIILCAAQMQVLDVYGTGPFLRIFPCVGIF